MTNIEILENMLKLQQKLNDQTNGLNWEDGYTKEGKLINWKRCIYMECAELIDSFNWKHWKNISNPINWENVRIEIVDIWHFILSLLLEKYRDKNFELIATEVNSVNVFQDFCKEEEHPNESDIYDILNDIELIIHKCSGFGFDLGELLWIYFTLAIKCGLNLENLYKLYIGKNILNIFRQDHGYKNGSYKKIWNGKEDNEVLNEILKEELHFDTIYKKLEKSYQKA
ncbi:dUTP diphosphatase [Campylobacter hepaticus]|uniref:dUTPase n=1 Tax=Campylobacter hepaticus TaxID=1813019 RepID=A0A424YYV1_9BACT|nr:dUTP diphosphatase [Campylobacter hepaticus]AXP09048.1 dUTPase [Campylobacter hepaticus]MCZ0771904.1 dUTP diphosphatase [Campylobacter hepaticus]MCZ0773373.1 dUTP diphosphatase [Campylobacter hepaticus]MCZ0774624.1 dUTP diphosphatase [Campylobacter hepaticus]MDX2323966.1 dUTP diphosphatase [Campylobacter hepaticus]